MEQYKGINFHPELKPVFIIIAILILLGIGTIYISNLQKFNFNYSELTINGTEIQEKLSYNPNKEYHTLYRNFENEIYWENNVPLNLKNLAIFKEIKCSSGENYLRNSLGECYNENGKFNCYAYTKNNEYGCTFGNVFGFLKNEKYTIESKYALSPENLFKINNNYYIKFVVYSPNNHIKLDEKNFVVIGEKIVRKDKYMPDENIVIYILYNGNIENFNIIEKTDFEFDSSKGYNLINYFAFIPAILFIFLWIFFGREKFYEGIPKELSIFPEKRKPWEVAAFFNPPFSFADKNIFSSTLLDFCNKKIIDIKEKNNEIYIKLNRFKGDEIEEQIYDYLKEISKNHKDKVLGTDYFNLEKCTQSQNTNALLKSLNLMLSINKKRKKYIENSLRISGISFLLLAISFFIFTNLNTNKSASISLSIFLFVTFWIIIVSTNKSILIRFKEKYYGEYQKWQAFKKYLKNSFSIKTATHKTAIIWKEYLVYATALGVSKKVIDELKNNHIITKEQLAIYNRTTTMSLAFSSSSSSSSSSGGKFSGAGGGGVGGGGGGGR